MNIEIIPKIEITNYTIINNVAMINNWPKPTNIKLVSLAVLYFNWKQYSKIA